MILLFDILMIILLLLIVTLLVKPLGNYMAKVFQGKPVFLSRFLRPVELLIYRVSGIKPDVETGWKRYAISMLLFNFIGFLILFAILIFQGFLPLNPQRFPGFRWDLAFNTAVSFVTNTNWQAYAGETAASYFTQVVGLAVQNFFSAATGICILIALIRGFAHKSSKHLGNFWVDMTRSILYVLLPICLILSLVLVSQGVIQNFSPYVHSSLIDPYHTAEDKTISEQVIPMGPIASQEAIKELGTNGGGFLNANSAHPFENPTPLSNFLEILAILLIPAALTYLFGSMVGDTRQGWAIYWAMMVIFVISLGVMFWAETKGNPYVQVPGVTGQYMEGKEVRFGIGGSALFATSTTAVSCGAVNSMHDSMTPIGGMVTMVLISLGEVVFGGIGSGLYTMLAFVVIAVFVAGLMIGRIPEYLGKKIEPIGMWMSVLIVLTPSLLVLIFFTIALITPSAVASILNSGPHGLSEILYASLSMSNNNGSAFAGLNANIPFFNILGAIVMLIGRFIPAICALAMAGSLANKHITPPSAGTLKTYSLTFVIWLIFVIIIVGALSFFPAFFAGPIIEQLKMLAGGG